RLALRPQGRRHPDRVGRSEGSRLYRRRAARPGTARRRGSVAEDARQGERDHGRTPPGAAPCSASRDDRGGTMSASAPQQPGERTTFEPYSAFEIPADLRALHGRWDVEATARRVRNFRYAEEWMMMLMGGWLATIPELPVKTGLGKIIWETAQAADTLGKRLPELRGGRKAVDRSESPNEGFAAFIRSVAEPEAAAYTIEKMVGVFDVLKPHLIEVYEWTMRETDQIADSPTIEILDDIARKTR